MTQEATPMYTLFHAPGACSLACVIALEEAEIPHRIEIVDIMGDREAYRRVNPAGKVPALLLPTHLLTENVAILVQIARSAPGKHLLAEDAETFCQQLSVMGWFASTVHITRRQIRRPVHFSTDAEVQAKLVEAARPKMWQYLLEMNERVARTGWFGGDRFSLVDAYALVMYSWAMRDEFPVADFVSLASWKTRMIERPAVCRSLLLDVGPLNEEARARLPDA